MGMAKFVMILNEKKKKIRGLHQEIERLKGNKTDFVHDDDDKMDIDIKQIEQKIGKKRKRNAMNENENDSSPKHKKQRMNDNHSNVNTDTSMNNIEEKKQANEFRHADKEFLVLLYVGNDDDAQIAYKEALKKNLDDDVHRDCYVGYAEHFTLFQWTGSRAEADMICFSEKPRIPIKEMHIPLTELKKWNVSKSGCFALGIDDVAAKKINEIMNLLVFPLDLKKFRRTSMKNLHMSLYRVRKRMFDEQTKANLNKKLRENVYMNGLRNGTIKRQCGSVSGLKVVVKERGEINDISYYRQLEEREETP